MYENYSWRYNIGWEWKEFDKHDGKNNCNTMFSRFSTEEEKHMLMLMHFRKNLYPTCTPPCKKLQELFTSGSCSYQEKNKYKKEEEERKKKKKESFSFFYEPPVKLHIQIERWSNWKMKKSDSS